MNHTGKTYMMQTSAMFSESYIREFIDKALKLGHIPSEKEFEYCEKDNGSEAKVENTLLMALSFTAALMSDNHKALLAMSSDRIKDTFKLFTDHGVVLTIFQNLYSGRRCPQNQHCGMIFSLSALDSIIDLLL